MILMILIILIIYYITTIIHIHNSFPIGDHQLGILNWGSPIGDPQLFQPIRNEYSVVVSQNLKLGIMNSNTSISSNNKS